MALAGLTSLNHDCSLCGPSLETPKQEVLEMIKEILIPMKCLAKLFGSQLRNAGGLKGYTRAGEHKKEPQNILHFVRSS